MFCMALDGIGQRPPYFTARILSGRIAVRDELTDIAAIEGSRHRTVCAVAQRGNQILRQVMIHDRILGRAGPAVLCGVRKHSW